MKLIVLQNNHVEKLTAPLAIAARERDIIVHDMSATPGMENCRPLPEGDFEKIMVYGSVLFVDKWARHQRLLTPWIFWHQCNMFANRWRDNLGERFLNHDGKYILAKDAYREQTLRHYRPVSAVKALSGAVLTGEQLSQKNLEDNFPLWSSPLSRIDAEVRVWFINGKMTAYSMYRCDGGFMVTIDHPLIPDAIAAAQQIVDIWSPEKHFVADVGLVDGVWKLIEFNPLHSAGWYAADPGAILDAYFR